MGMQDAFNLAWKLSLVIRNTASPQLLDSFEAERKPLDEAVIRQTDRATRLVSLHGSATRFIRDHMMSWVARCPDSRRDSARRFRGLQSTTGTARLSKSILPTAGSGGGRPGAGCAAHEGG
jgi:2-polyprenyl-6-methoxyphenol hydroxylase-like FAD-dependent oxidoreductase